jgi:hypothetical protein
LDGSVRYTPEATTRKRLEACGGRQAKPLRTRKTGWGGQGRDETKKGRHVSSPARQVWRSGNYEVDVGRGREAGLSGIGRSKSGRSTLGARDMGVSTMGGEPGAEDVLLRRSLMRLAMTWSTTATGSRWRAQRAEAAARASRRRSSAGTSFQRRRPFATAISVTLRLALLRLIGTLFHASGRDDEQAPCGRSGTMGRTKSSCPPNASRSAPVRERKTRSGVPPTPRRISRKVALWSASLASYPAVDAAASNDRAGRSATRLPNASECGRGRRQDSEGRRVRVRGLATRLTTRHDRRT